MRWLSSIYLTMLLWGYGQVSFAGMDGQGTSDGTMPFEEQVKPDTDIDELFERQRQHRQEGKQRRFEHLATRFVEKFGYSPKDYVLRIKEAGTNITVYSASFWYKFHVKPVEGTIEVRHQTITRDIFTGLPKYHDHETLAVKFTLDPEVCRRFADGSHCTFDGKNSVRLPSFMDRHQILKDGIWEITYIESGKVITSSFKVPPDELPEGTHQGVTMNQIDTDICRTFPDNLSCQTGK